MDSGTAGENQNYQEDAMYITITGKLGSGKSTVCRLISEEKGYQIYSTGKIQRGIAAKMGISTLELNQLMNTNPEYDDLIDREVVRISESSVGENILFDSRMAFHFVKESFKIFAYVSPNEAARRVMGDARGNVETYRDMEDAREQLLKRSQVENLRFQDIYHIDNLDYANYNLIIDTTWETPERIAEEICRGLETYLENPDMRQLAFSPKSLYPMTALAKLDPDKLSEAAERFENGAPQEPVVIAQSGTFHYIVSGIETVAAALRAQVPFVKAVMAEDGGTVPETLPEVALSAYESLGGFIYKDYPPQFE